MRSRISLRAATASVLAGVALAGTPASTYPTEIEQWRQQRETNLKGDESWLTVAGLFFLKPGVNTVGSDRSNDVVLPSSAPKRVGVFEFHAGKTVVKVDKDVTVTLNGAPLQGPSEMKPGAPGKPADTIALGGLKMFVHLSGERYAIRLRDQDSRIRRNFTGLKWFPVNEAYRVLGRYIPDPTPPRVIKVPNILGDDETYTTGGVVAFTLNGQQFRLRPMLSGPKQTRLFFIIRDLTSGKETYSSSRFLYADLADDGAVVMDFNKAQNPPCAFNPYTTCPLPPQENRMTVRVEAGERDYGHHTATTAQEAR